MTDLAAIRERCETLAREAVDKWLAESGIDGSFYRNRAGRPSSLETIVTAALLALAEAQQREIERLTEMLAVDTEMITHQASAIARLVEASRPFVGMTGLSPEDGWAPTDELQVFIEDVLLFTFTVGDLRALAAAQPGEDKP